MTPESLNQLARDAADAMAVYERDGCGVLRRIDDQQRHWHIIQSVLTTATDSLRKENERLEGLVIKYETRLCIDPGGSDKIDELDSVMGWVKADRDRLQAELEKARRAIRGFLDHRSAVFDAQIHDKPLPDGIDRHIEVLQAVIDAID